MRRLLLGTILSITCQVVCMGNGPQFAEPIQNVTVPLFRNATLSCIVDHLEGFRVAWMKADTETILTIHTHVITHNSRIRMSRNGIRQWNLHIDFVQENDRGKYMCQINTEPMRKQEGYLEVVVPPDIVGEDSSSDVTANEGQSISLTCKATGYPKPNITWRREDNELITLRLPLKKKMKVSNITSDTLNISRVHRRHMGVYLCIASNGVPPSVSKRVRLQVNFHPVIKVPNHFMAAHVGTEVELECHVDVSPQSANYWVKHNNPIITSHKYNVKEVEKSAYKLIMKLTIRDLEVADFDTYSCISKNTLGEANGTIRLRELESPSTRKIKVEVEEKVGGHQIVRNDWYSSHKSTDLMETSLMYGLNHSLQGRKYEFTTVHVATSDTVKDLQIDRDWSEGTSGTIRIGSSVIAVAVTFHFLVLTFV